MKAHRRMLVAATMALSATLAAGPAFADVPSEKHGPDIEITSAEGINLQEIECSSDGLLNLLGPINVLSCFSFQAD